MCEEARKHIRTGLDNWPHLNFICVKTVQCDLLRSLSHAPPLSVSLLLPEMSRQTATALPTGTSKCPPSQRVPTLSGTTASNSDLASLFECPVCFDYVLPPILQCQSGHLVCSVQPGKKPELGFCNAVHLKCYLSHLH